jgi:hypothetical protein
MTMMIEKQITETVEVEINLPEIFKTDTGGYLHVSEEEIVSVSRYGIEIYRKSTEPLLYEMKLKDACALPVCENLEQFKSAFNKQWMKLTGSIRPINNSRK